MKLYALLGVVLGALPVAAAPRPQSAPAPAQTPVDVVRDFIRAYERGDFPQMARHVVGANPNNFLILPSHIRSYREYPVQQLDWPYQHWVRLRLFIQIDGGQSSGSRNVYAPSYEWVKVGLVNGVWKIVPPAPELEDGYLFGRGELSIQASQLAFPIHPGVAWTKQRICQLQVEGLLSALQVHSYRTQRNVITVSPQNWKQKLQSELSSHDKRQFSCWETGDSYSFNSKVRGLEADSQRPDAARIVVFYEGSDEKLDFHHPEGSVVGFLDGHAATIRPQQIQTLIWSPK